MTADDVRVEFHRSHTESVNQVLRRKFDAGVAKAGSLGSAKYRAAGLVAFTNVTCISMPWVARAGLRPEVVIVLRRSLLSLRDTRVLDLLPDKPTGFEPATAAEYDEMRDHRVRADRFLGSHQARRAGRGTTGAEGQEKEQP